MYARNAIWVTKAYEINPVYSVCEKNLSVNPVKMPKYYNCRRGNHTSNTYRVEGSHGDKRRTSQEKAHDCQGDGTSRLVVARSRQPLGKK